MSKLSAVASSRPCTPRRLLSSDAVRDEGLLAPGVDYDKPHPYLKDIVDKIDAEGYVHLPKGPGMGYQIEWDYINDNLMDPNVTTKKTHW